MREDTGAIAPLFSVAVAVALLSMMDAIVKYLSADFGTLQIVFLRYLGGFAFALPFLIGNGLPDFNRKSIKAGTIRAVLSVITATSFFYAVRTLPLAEAITIAFTAPLFIAILGKFILGETISNRALTAILIGFAGVMIIMAPELLKPADKFNESVIWGYAFASIASLGYAAVMVLTRLHSAHDTAPVLVFLQTMFALLLTAPTGIYFWQPIPVGLWHYFALLGLGGTIGHLAMAWAFARANAARLGPIEYTAFIWASLFGYMIFDDIPGFWSCFGALFILGACLLVAKGPGKATAALAKSKPAANIS